MSISPQVTCIQQPYTVYRLVYIYLSHVIIKRDHGIVLSSRAYAIAYMVDEEGDPSDCEDALD